MKQPRTSIGSRSAIIAAALALGAGSLLAPAAAQADSTATSVTPTPANSSCSTTMWGVSPTRQIVSYAYRSDAGKATLYTSSGTLGQLGFIPTTFAKKESRGGGSPDALGQTGVDFYAVAPDGNLWVVGINNDDSIVQKKLNSTWGVIRHMTAVPAISGTTGAYLYGLTTAGGLNRYSIPSGPATPVGPTVVSPSGWAKIKTLAFSHIATLPNNDLGDVLIATITDGRLIEYTIPHKTPTKVISKVVVPGSWQNITSMAVGSCYGSAAQIMIGTLANGDAHLYYDKNRDTALQTDISGLGRIATGWVPRTSSGGAM